MKKKIKIKIIDLIVYFAVIINTAFFDQLYLVIVSQVLLFISVLLNTIFIKKTHFSKWDWHILLRMVLLFSLGSLSCLWAINNNYATNGLISIGQVIMVSLSINFYISEKRDYNKVLFSFVVGALIIVLRLLATTDLNSIYQIGYHLGVAFGYDRAHIGMITAYASLFLLYFKDLKKNYLFYLPIPLLLFICFATGSRKGLVIFLVGFVLYFVLSRKNFKAPLLLSIIFVVSFVLINNVDFLYDAIGSRIHGFFNYLSGGNGDASAKTRAILLNDAFRVAGDNFIFGVGLDNFRFYTNEFLPAHINYLEILCDIGVVGLCVYYYLPIKSLIFGIKNSFQPRNNDILLNLSITILACVLFNDLFLVSYQMEYIQMLMVVSMSGIMNVYKNYEMLEVRNDEWKSRNMCSI